MKKLLLATAAAWAASAGYAFAMPAAIGGIGALVGGIGSGISLGSIALGVASMGAQWLISKMLAPEQKQRGIKTRMETGGDNPPSFIVGEYATAGQLVYANAIDGGTNIPESLLVYVICLSTLPIEAVSDTIYINNEKCTIDTSETFSGFYAVEEYVKGTGQGGYCSIKFHLGGQSTADSFMMDKFGSDPDRPWSNDFFLPGCAYAVIRCWYSNRGIWTGLPEFRFTVKGAKLYDPRKDTTVGGSGSHRWGNQNTWEYTRNPKVIEYNIIRGLKYDNEHFWGGRAEEYRLPLEYWFAAMNVCDEDITRKDDEVIKRYRMGAEITLDEKPIDVINRINDSCSGYTTEFGGTYKTWCGGYGLSVGTITDDDFLITAEMETNRFQPRQVTYNTAYTTYPEPKQQWEVKDGPRYQDEDAVEEDGEELPLDIALPYVSENNQAQRIARNAIKDSRRQVTHSGQLGPTAWPYEPFDRLTYFSEQFGYSGDGKDFIVATKEDLPNVNQQVMLREINADDPGWLVAYEQDWEAAPLVLIGATDLELDVDVYPDEVEGPGGKDRPAIRAEWLWGNGDEGPGEVDVRYIDWRIRRNGATKIIARGKIEAPEDDEGIVSSNVLRWGKDYEIQFRAVPFGIRASAWTAWKDVTMTAVEVPTGLTLSQQRKQGADGKNDFFVIANWDDTDQDNNGYGVKITIDGDSEYKKTDGSRYKFPVKAPETVQVQVRTRGTEGSVSAYCDPETINVTKKADGPAKATGLTVKRRPRGNRLKWDKSTDPDYKQSRIYRGTTSSFGSAVEIDAVSGTTYLDDDETLTKGTNYKYWVKHENWSENLSALESDPDDNTFELIGTSDTDRTTLSAPTGVSLTQANRDVDKDGTVDIALLTTFSGGVAGATGYEVEWVDSAGQTASARADTGKFWFKANTIRSYQARWRAYDWTNAPGNWSSYTSSVTPAGTVGAPATPSTVGCSAYVLGLIVSWAAPSELDYAYSEVAILSSAGTPSTADIIGTTTGQRLRILENGGLKYAYVRHVNTSGLKSAWAGATATQPGDLTSDEYQNSSVGRAALASGAAVATDSNNLGTSLSGSVSVAGGFTKTLLTLTWKATSNTAGVTVNLGGRSASYDFVDGQSYCMQVEESGGGSFSCSKSGGGSQAAAYLTAIGTY